MSEQRRNAHLHVDKPLHVILGSIGSDIRYELQTKDLTTKGFFLESKSPGRFQFTLSSIVEVWIEVEANSVVFFNSKIARVITTEEATLSGEIPGISFRIIQIEPEEEKKLADFLNKKLDQIESAEHASEQNAKAS